MRLREKAAARFEASLDIRNFVALQTNLVLILDLLLTKEQKLMFRYQSGRTVSGGRKRRLMLMNGPEEVERAGGRIIRPS